MIQGYGPGRWVGCAHQPTGTPFGLGVDRESELHELLYFRPMPCAQMSWLIRMEENFILCG